MLLLLRRQDYHIGAWRGLLTASATAATSAAAASLSDEGLGLTDGLKNEVDACAEMQFSSELHSAWDYERKMAHSNLLHISVKTGVSAEYYLCSTYYLIIYVLLFKIWLVATLGLTTFSVF